MKYFISIMKYIALAILMANTCMTIYYLFFGDALNVVISVVLEICLFIENYLFNKYAREAWDTV